MPTESKLTRCGLFSRDAAYVSAITGLAKVLCALPVEDVHAELEDYAINMSLDLNVAFSEVDPAFSAELDRLSGADNGRPRPIGAKVAAAKSEIATCSAFCQEREYAGALHQLAQALVPFGVQAVHEETEVDSAPNLMIDLDVAISEIDPEFHRELAKLSGTVDAAPGTAALRRQAIIERIRAGHGLDPIAAKMN